MNLELKKEIGARIEKIRIEKLNGMSQAKLGKAIGTTGQNIGLIINGNGSLSLDKAIKFCEFANVSMDFVFRGIDDNKHINIDSVIEAVNNFNNKID